VDQTNVAWEIVESKPEGRRKVERRRLRWLEDEENDIRELKVKRWRQKANNREEWKCRKGDRGR
jgi:hypothetical protein